MLAAPVTYVGHTHEGRRVVLIVAAGAVTTVRVGIAHYRCATFGELGPVVVAERGRAALDAGGAFAFAGGVPAEHLAVTGRLRGGHIRGSLRLRGTIATGQRCASARIVFAATRR